jgi:predicted RNA-binding Zn-ribbon protein involved in translation (DUF1610 family)
MYESFKDTCPKCGSDSIKVVEATLVATGEVLHMNADLYKDGFLVPAPDDLKDQSTEDEKCRCTACGHEFDLSEVTL